MKILKALSNAVDPNYWAERIGTKTGATTRHMTLDLHMDS